MRSFKTRTVIATAVAVLAFAGVAYAGTGTLRHDRDKLKDGSCLTTVVAGDKVRLHDGAKDRDQLKLQDGSCLTTAVADGHHDGRPDQRSAAPPRRGAATGTDARRPAEAAGRQLPDHGRGRRPARRTPPRRHGRPGSAEAA